jgi:hypothetical protein
MTFLRAGRIFGGLEGVLLEQQAGLLKIYQLIG